MNDSSDRLKAGLAGDGHVPRAYQEEIFAEARRANVIAALGTGAGKTLIAAMLVRWAAATQSQPSSSSSSSSSASSSLTPHQNNNNNNDTNILPAHDESDNGNKNRLKDTPVQATCRKKVVVFLVPKVPLVHQQRDFLARQTPLDVRAYSGAMGTDVWDRGRWAREFSAADVLVMTAQVFKNILTHGVWSLENVSLLIFDECHHARQNHPYNVIMKDHYSVCKDKPRVFGMTASPTWKSNDPLRAIQTLQSNLHAKVMSVREHADELEQHSSKPNEIVLLYPKRPTSYDYPTPTLWDYLTSMNIPGTCENRIETRYMLLMDELGPAAAEHFLIHHLQALLARYESGLGLVQSSPGRGHGRRETSTNMGLTSAKKSGMTTAATAITDELDTLTASQTLQLRSLIGAFARPLLTKTHILPKEWLSPKVRAMVKTLCEEHDRERDHVSSSSPGSSPSSSPSFHASSSSSNSGFHGIVFVEQRQVAAGLVWVLGKLEETREWVRCAVLTGHGDSSGAMESGRKAKTSASVKDNGNGNEKGDLAMAGMNAKDQKYVVQAFRNRELNLLIATSVAEEGLDFPACKIVIRYNTITHMVGYLQSRGRARQRQSTYVIMIEEEDTDALERYTKLRHAEPELKTVYEKMNTLASSKQDGEEGDREDEGEEMDDVRDIEDRESYIIPSTGASLHYSSAVNIIEHLCSLITRDPYTPSLQPVYTISTSSTSTSTSVNNINNIVNNINNNPNPTYTYTATIHLPHVLPLPPSTLLHTGSPKRTKREAKRSAAFSAARALHVLGVLDAYLAPVQSKRGEVVEDADGRAVPHVKEVPVMLDVEVVSPWVDGRRIRCGRGNGVVTMGGGENGSGNEGEAGGGVGETVWYLHDVSIDGVLCAALVCGRTLPEVEIFVHDQCVRMEARTRSSKGPEIILTEERVDLLERFTKMGIWWCATSSQLLARPGCFLAPLLSHPGHSHDHEQGASDSSIDWDAMAHALEFSMGNHDWNEVYAERDEGVRLLMNGRQLGRTYVLKKLDTGFRMHERPPSGILSIGEAGEGSDEEEKEEEGYETWEAYFEECASRWNKRTKPNSSVVLLPPSGPIMEVQYVERSFSALYTLEKEMADNGLGDTTTIESADISKITKQQPRTLYLPQSYCKQTSLSPALISTFRILAPLCQRISDLFRAHTALHTLHLPPITPSLLSQALILPLSNSKPGYNNQRLETLGDSVLKLCVVVYVFMKFPMKHEGQLSALKAGCVSNRTLLARAREVGLERFLTSEVRCVRAWQSVLGTSRVEDGEEKDQDEVLERECRHRDHGQASVGELDVHVQVQTVRREFPRRSLQDCMEAVLGASYLTGGIDMALQAGTALGLCFGGGTPWSRRVASASGCNPSLGMDVDADADTRRSMGMNEKPAPPLFANLQEELGYTFRNGALLVEAATHPSFEPDDGTCYQRLEFLGDAIIELVVTTLLFEKYPDATSGQLTWARSHVLCNTTLAAVGVKRLGLHTYLLANSMRLVRDIAKVIGDEDDASENDSPRKDIENNPMPNSDPPNLDPTLCLNPCTIAQTSYAEIVKNDWRFDPPKALGDIFEAVVGAVFVDCGFQYEVVRDVVLRVMSEVLEALTLDVPRNPTTRLLEWMGKKGCTRTKFEKWPSTEWDARAGTVEVVILVHGQVIAGPMRADNAAVARAFVAEEAMRLLQDEGSEKALERICDCARAREGKKEEQEQEQKSEGLKEKGENEGADADVDMERENLAGGNVGTDANIDRTATHVDSSSTEIVQEEGQEREEEEEPNDLSLRLIREKDIDTDSERGFAIAARVRAEQSDAETASTRSWPDSNEDFDEYLSSIPIRDLNPNMESQMEEGPVRSTPSVIVSELEHDEVEQMFLIRSAAVSSAGFESEPMDVSD